MSDRYQADTFDTQPPDFRGNDRPHDAPRRREHPPLPAFLARRWLRPGEQVTWVVGPRFNPSWEYYVTHPALAGVALAVGVLSVVTGRMTVESWANLPIWPPVVAGGLFFGSVVVLGVCCGYFTRLVVTNQRLLLTQGREIYRKWNIDDLPRSLLRYGRRDRGERDRDDRPTIDLDALQTMLGSASDQFADAKTIVAFGKQLGHIKAREEGRP
jgi:hypothetical protein